MGNEPEPEELVDGDRDEVVVTGQTATAIATRTRESQIMPF